MGQFLFMGSLWLSLWGSLNSGLHAQCAWLLEGDLGAGEFVFPLMCPSSEPRARAHFVLKKEGEREREKEREREEIERPINIMISMLNP